MIGADSWPKNNGSSPQARGTLCLRRTTPGSGRFIPAGAGNTRDSCHATRPTAVHPRRRGEHPHFTCDLSPQIGSSPQARGTHIPRSIWYGLRRFIPAGAGNTCHLAAARGHRTVHPRRRGEHLLSRVAAPTGCGSSPQARGTRCPAASGPMRRRFIPAGAGNTIPICLPVALHPVHPRRRGEHGVIPSSSSLDDGSSPQARGTHSARDANHLVQRFIPAGAGNTRAARNHTGQRSVHPRRRGEHCRSAAVARAKIGSSPQARGTLFRRAHLII